MSARPLAKTISRAALISSPVSGASGWRGGERAAGHVGLMLRAATSMTLYDRPMEAAADRADHSARELGRRLGVEHHDVLVLLGSGLSGTAEALGAGEAGASPSTRCPSSRPTRPAGTGPSAWSVGTERPPGPGAGRALPSLRGPDARRGRPSRSGPASPPAAAPSSSPPPPEASGTISPPGPIMVVDDHLNLTGRSPLIGPDFVDMADAYDPRLRGLCPGHARARRVGAGGSSPASTPSCPAPSSRRRPRSACCARPAPTSWGCRWRSRPSRPARPEPRSSGSPSSPTRPRRPAPRSTSPTSPTSAAAAVPAVAAIVRHVVGSLA